MSILIVSDSPIQGKKGEIIGVDEFMKRATSDSGISVEELYININDISPELYGNLEDFTFFTLTGGYPVFAEGANIKNWRAFDGAAVKKTEAPKQEVRFANVIDRNTDDEVRIKNIINEEEIVNVPEVITKPNGKQARVMLFGSSKGGTGKTFTCLISAYRFAKQNPNLRIAVSDFDIIDGQVGISIHKVTPTVLNFYSRWAMGDHSFETMKKSSVKAKAFPQNIDFYLAPKDRYIDNDDFWNTVFMNLIDNYDVVFFDTGIDYLNYPPISTVYKIADKILLISTTSIKSVSSVKKQIQRLKGDHENDVFTKEDGLGDRMHLILTQVGVNDTMNNTVFKTFEKDIDIIAKFGVLTTPIQKAEYFSQWDIFDDHKQFNALLDKITE